MTKKFYRQGDVGILQIESSEIPKEAKEVNIKGPVILAYGEVTGHTHRFEEGSIAVLELGNDKFIKINSPSNLRHEEHDPINIPAGDYKIIQQREYTPQEIRRVVD